MTILERFYSAYPEREEFGGIPDTTFRKISSCYVCIKFMNIEYGKFGINLSGYSPRSSSITLRHLSEFRSLTPGKRLNFIFNKPQQ
ncbi:hypothetical protein BC943DRAFT_320360 [Umbelopsis sp. AD052]|nr:hypothetical protein BC943DRAFT_320360 [Umbelopsis sp. AD052]